ncbi:T5orf172 domain-containing protein [Rhizobium sp. PP-F2F-G38]|nr:T5orf172 domain-containing protein [Rhizobium sp. PP-F2F-G38]
MSGEQLALLVSVLGVPMWALVATFMAWRRSAEIASLRRQVDALEQRYAAIGNEEAEVERLKQVAASINVDIYKVRGSYMEKKALFDRLAKEVAVFDEKLAFAEMGVYEPHFDFTDSETYKQAILECRETQKRMVSGKSAAIAKTEWTVSGSKAKGQTMNNRNVKLALRAFNNECEAAVANVRWNNAKAMEKRVVNARQQIDNLNATNDIEISDEYLRQKLIELRLTHEHREKLKAEREERAEMARAAREEQKFVRDMERAEEEEGRYQRLLDKARSDAEQATADKIGSYDDRIRMLEKDLADAHAKFERAQAMAERTRSGYVYIISNIGSFGDEVVKIGLTRRLDPADRVRELGDASVPFLFDTHAIIYSDDAPALERALHNEFQKTRINAQNFRKEFFRVSIDEVENAVSRLAPGAPFFKDVEAQEYRETLARRNAMLAAVEPPVLVAFPATI